MHTLNIYSRTPEGQYLFSVTQDTRKACLAIAQDKYSDLAWAWDDKSYVKHKKYNPVPGSTVHLNLSQII